MADPQTDQQKAEAPRPEAKVPDAAVAPVPKAEAIGQDQDFSVSSSIGGRFRLRGNGFGSSGVVTFNGKPVQTVGWGNEYIEGLLPSDVESGPVIVQVSADKQLKGYFTR